LYSPCQDRGTAVKDEKNKRHKFDGISHTVSREPGSYTSTQQIVKKTDPTEFERFRDATKQILSVSKKEVDAAMKRDKVLRQKKGKPDHHQAESDI
jgi:uncharacterized protein (DUF1786 family)